MTNELKPQPTKLDFNFMNLSLMLNASFSNAQLAASQFDVSNDQIVEWIKNENKNGKGSTFKD